MNASFPGREGVPGKITAKHLIFVAFLDLAISGAPAAAVFVSAFGHLYELMFIDSTPRSLGTIKDCLFGRMP